MIYVDRLRETKKSRDWPFPSGCHLLADSVQELHEFAAWLGMKRCWFQSAARLPHYDLNARRRAQAIELGAKEIDRREVSRRIRAARGIKADAPILQDEWRGCYRESWKGVIVDESIVHPAKYSRSLIKRIYDHLFECGLLAAGQSVIDPFGGIALGALEAMRHGCHWEAVELESRFQAFGVQNIAMWNDRYSSLSGWGTARIHCGDSRRLLDVIRSADACVSSPPFNANQSNGKHDESKGFHSYDHNESYNRMKRDYLLPETEGNLGNLPMDEAGFQAAISSPPYADQLDPNRGGGKDKDGFRQGSTSGKFFTDGYSGNADNLGNMPEGDFNACVSSPPFNANKSNAIHGQTKGFISYDKNAPKNRMKRDYLLAETEGNLGNMDMSDGGFNTAISSPPFADTLGSDDPDKRGGLFTKDDKRRNDKSLTGTYGTTEGQLGALDDKGFDAAISSPPFADCLAINPSDKEAQRERQRQRGRNPNAPGAGIDSDYGSSEGQLGALKDDFDAVVSSPPYEGSQVSVPDTNLLRGEGWTHLSAKCHGGGQVIYDYQSSPGNLGASVCNSFWLSARDIVAQTFESLAPGGVACWVTKAYIKDSAVVDFPGRWRQLCESVGFVTIHEHHALQVEHKGEQGALFGESKQIKSARKSFFKLIYEKKRPDLAIDYEVVWCMVKPK